MRENPHERALNPETEQRTDLHRQKLRFQIGNDRRKINACIRDDDAGSAVYDTLRNVKHRHDDVPCVGHKRDRDERLENPFEEHERLKVVHVVALHNHLNQLVGHHEREDNAGNGQHDGFREILHHGKHAAVPCLRRAAHVHGDLRHAGIDAVKEACQVAHDRADQHGRQPFCKPRPNKVHAQSLPSGASRAAREAGRSVHRHQNSVPRTGIRVVPTMATPAPAISCLMP